MDLQSDCTAQQCSTVRQLSKEGPKLCKDEGVSGLLLAGMQMVGTLGHCVLFG